MSSFPPIQIHIPSSFITPRGNILPLPLALAQSRAFKSNRYCTLHLFSLFPFLSASASKSELP